MMEKIISAILLATDMENLHITIRTISMMEKMDSNYQDTIARIVRILSEADWYKSADCLAWAIETAIETAKKLSKNTSNKGGSKLWMQSGSK